ncbi:hypothetical protein OPV22_005600 [Ensete ventricosum]|uniref:Uncharacterized protein n=1 Tax=Ensete ventricosum TaxID=4639 RepID=A0AAV8RLE2_ENSVE|nr:hypothetical protein OPV22_005600 [Ensete ventricosum]
MASPFSTQQAAASARTCPASESTTYWEDADGVSEQNLLLFLFGLPAGGCGHDRGCREEWPDNSWQGTMDLNVLHKET